MPAAHPHTDQRSWEMLCEELEVWHASPSWRDWFCLFLSHSCIQLVRVLNVLYGLLIPLCFPSCTGYSSKWMELRQPINHKLDVAGIPPLSYMPTLVFHFLMQQGKQLEQLFKTCLIQALYFVFLCVAARLSFFLPVSEVLSLIWR